MPESWMENLIPRRVYFTILGILQTFVEMNQIYEREQSQIQKSRV